MLKIKEISKIRRSSMNLVCAPVLCLAMSLPLASCSSGGGGASIIAFGVEWTVPSTREDGTELLLSEVKEYRIYYGVEEGEYPDVFVVEDPSTLESQVSVLQPGKYFVVVTIVDTEDRESSYSEPLSITI